MAATSLSEQLQKLSVPQATVYADAKKTASLLFDPSEAAAKDRDTFYEIGLSGLKELIALHEGFRLYEDTLFNISSKDFERAVETKEVNANLDQTIEKFLLQLSPYFLLQSAHKALEWLVNRYHIHQYNVDAVMSLILPYHETKIFVRFVQLLAIKKHNKWMWLWKIQKKGIALTKQVLYNQCASNPDTLQFIAKNSLRHVLEYGERGNQLNTVFAHFCSTAIGTMNSGKVHESIINALLPTLMKALDSPIVDFRSSAHVVLGFLSTKAVLKTQTLETMIDKMLTTEFDITYDVVLLINLLYTNQEHMTKMSNVILINMSDDVMITFCEYLKKLVEQKIDIHSFVLAFLSGVLPMVLSDMEDFRRFGNLPSILIDGVDLKNQQPKLVIQCILDAYRPKHETFKDVDSDDGNESDVEFVADEDDFSIKVLTYMSTLLKSMETKYPEAFDSVIQQEMRSDGEKSTTRQKYLSKILSFKPAVAHKVRGVPLFENLNHVNPKLRIEAVKYIAKEFQSLKADNIDFVKESILDRFNDDNVGVVAATLKIPDDCLKGVLTEVDLTSTFVKIVSRTSREWRNVICDTIVKFCAFDALPVNHQTVLTLLPFCFPQSKAEAEMTWQIISSTWGRKFGILKKLKGVGSTFKDNAEVLCQAIFKVLFIDSAINFDDILDVTMLNKDNTLDVCFYLLLKSSSFSTAAIDEISDVLNLLLESVENRAIVASSVTQSFSVEIIPEFISMAIRDKILFESMEYIFQKIIEDMNITGISKPWCNVCESTDAILLKRLYEIFVTGCSIPSYAENYIKLLQQLLKKFFTKPKEKFEFVANFVCGHILYATDPKDVISPELQIRSVKLLRSFLTTQYKSDWLYDSDVVILMILFNLNNPVTAIRQSTIDFIQDLLSENADKSRVYIQLLKELWAHRQECLLDHEQIPQVLNIILNNSVLGNKLFRKNCMLKFENILAGDAPAYIKSSFLKILSQFDNANAFLAIVKSLNCVEKVLKENDNPKALLNIYESNIVKSVFSHINTTTVTTFTNDEVWNYVEWGLKEYRECILEEDQTFTSPCVHILKQIEENVFKKIPDDKSKILVYMIAKAGTLSNNPNISSAASKAMKKIHVKFLDFKPILEGMLNAKDPEANIPKKKKNVAVALLSYRLTETDEWRLGVTLLEYIQSKKKMTVDNSLVVILFQLLNRCLRFEEQSYVEYTKQLILSSLWYYCKKFVDETDKDQIKSLKLIFDVELVVQCIRGSQNPQTHHHALILLSHAAFLLPEQVLHHTMEIFTFMGSSVLRHDDAYSFQVITKIIETLIPILVKLDRNIEDYSKIELKQLQDRVVPVLRIFADVVLHVPEHRRLPLFKKLIETLGPSQFLWVFLALLLETHVANSPSSKKKEKSSKRMLAEQDAPIDRLDFGQSLVLEFSPEICLENFVQLIIYAKSLPSQKDENQMDTGVDPSDIFSVNGHTAIQVRHFKYVVITFVNTSLASTRFIQHCSQATDAKLMETHFKSIVVNILTFIQSLSKMNDEKIEKYRRVMLHHSYDLLDHTNTLLSPTMFISVVRGLLKHHLVTVRRKSMELLNSKIQYSPEIFSEVDKELMFSLIPQLLNIVKTIETKEQNLDDINTQELELNQQTALLSLKLLAKLLASEYPGPFKRVLFAITDYTCDPNISGPVMASVVLCLAELCGNMKVHALSCLRKFMPALIKVLKRQRIAETPELVLLSTVTAISKIVESLPLFLSPYLQKILYEYSMLLAKWQNFDQECSKVSAIVAKLSNIKKKIAGSIPPRVLIPVANETHKLLLEKENFDAIGPVMSLLADSFGNVTTADFTTLQQDLTGFFMSALQLRSDAVDKDVNSAFIDRAEDEVVNALVCLVLKLSETSFRPFYFKIYDWAIRSNVEGHKDRTITFYRLSSAIADKLKGLFVLFAGHFIRNAAELLDACNMSKTEDLYFDSNEKCITLVKYIIKTLHTVFLYDSQSFLNKDRFETLMQPIVDQLENTLGGIISLKSRAAESVIPCIAQFAVATADDSLWKLLNYQILLKIRHSDAEIRLIALECLVSMATQLGSSWLPLLAESVPFLAELLEDGDARIETATKDAIRKLEQILGEPLEKYF